MPLSFEQELWHGLLPHYQKDTPEGKEPPVSYLGLNVHSYWVRETQLRTFYFVSSGSFRT